MDVSSGPTPQRNGFKVRPQPADSSAFLGRCSGPKKSQRDLVSTQIISVIDNSSEALGILPRKRVTGARHNLRRYGYDIVKVTKVQGSKVPLPSSRHARISFLPQKATFIIRIILHTHSSKRARTINPFHEKNSNPNSVTPTRTLPES
jgi:hypothetical protein